MKLNQVVKSILSGGLLLGLCINAFAWQSSEMAFQTILNKGECYD